LSFDKTFGSMSDEASLGLGTFVALVIASARKGASDLDGSDVGRG